MFLDFRCSRGGQLLCIFNFSSKDDFDSWMSTWKGSLERFLEQQKALNVDAAALAKREASVKEMFGLFRTIETRCDDKYANPGKDIALSALLFENEASKFFTDMCFLFPNIAGGAVTANAGKE